METGGLRMIERNKKTLKTSHRAVFGGTLLSRNDRVWGTTQHSQKENSQAEKSAQKLPLPTGEGMGEGSTFNSATVK